MWYVQGHHCGLFFKAQYPTEETARDAFLGYCLLDSTWLELVNPAGKVVLSA